MKPKPVIDYIVNWLKLYCKQHRMNGFAVGISGGIDSALTSTLCAKTGKKTVALNMPIHQAKPEYDRANEHIDWLKQKFPNVSFVEVNLSGVFQSICSTLPQDIQEGLTMANTRARLRMLTLYAFAGADRLLVAGTGNKVEDFGVGFFTKYGDGGVDISPIAELMKSQVYALAAELGITPSILKAVPTDGLWIDSRSDESQIGASYDELEWAMTYLNSKSQISNSRFQGKPERKDLPTGQAGAQFGRLMLTARQKKVLKIYMTHHQKNLHKMTPIPVCRIPRKLLGGSKGIRT